MQERDTMYEMLDVIEGCFFGKYRGLVKDNDDPSGRGRLKVVVPAVMGKRQVWAMPCTPYAGKNMGLYAIPEIETGVWIEFEAGDTSYPIWVGCYWADRQAPKDERGGGPRPSRKILRSRQGMMVTLDDQEQAITLSDRDGSNLITIDVQQGTITVKGTSKVVVDAPQIELVENGSHPVVFGDKLLQYLNTLVAAYHAHKHVGAAVLPPLLPPTPDLLSFRVKTG